MSVRIHADVFPERAGGRILALGLLGVLAGVISCVGCGPVFVGGRYAVDAFDQNTGQSVRPRVVIAFYDHWKTQWDPGAHWGMAVQPQEAAEGIRYPGRSYWDWGMFVLALRVPTRSVNPAVCVLSEDYWPCFHTTNKGFKGGSHSCPK